MHVLHARRELHGMELSVLQPTHAQVGISSTVCPTNASPRVHHAVRIHIGTEQSVSAHQDSTKLAESAKDALQELPMMVPNAPVANSATNLHHAVPTKSLSMENVHAVQVSIELKENVLSAQTTHSGMESIVNAPIVIQPSGALEPLTLPSPKAHAAAKVDMFQSMESASLHLETYDYG